MGPGSIDQTYYQGRHCGENWGDERKPIFIQQGKKPDDTPPPRSCITTAACEELFLSPSPLGSFDIISLPESKGQPPKAEMPAYVNTQQIDAQVLAALQAEGDGVTKGLASVKESPQKDLFDMSECEEDVAVIGALNLWFLADLIV